MGGKEEARNGVLAAWCPHTEEPAHVPGSQAWTCDPRVVTQTRGN